MEAVSEVSTVLQTAYWLAVRGTQQLDLAERFAAAAHAAELRVLGLKGVSIAQELYGSVENRPMADIDFLVVDTERFEEAAHVARALGLVEIGASDHALVFKEVASGVVLELHVSLTACPGLFDVDHQALWTRRSPTLGSNFMRLGDADLVVHLSLHTAFQHGFTANEFHYDDFRRALEALRPGLDDVRLCARESGALPTLAAMAHACERRFPESLPIRALADATSAECPHRVVRWIDSWTLATPPLSIATLAWVRYQLSPSSLGYIRRSLLPALIPGRTLPRASSWRRIANILRAGSPS